MMKYFVSIEHVLRRGRFTSLVQDNSPFGTIIFSLNFDPFSHGIDIY